MDISGSLGPRSYSPLYASDRTGREIPGANDREGKYSILSVTRFCTKYYHNIVSYNAFFKLRIHVGQKESGFWQTSCRARNYFARHC